MKQFKNQKELFEYIWETRPHISEFSGEPLLPKGHFQWHWQFMHCLPKGSYLKYKLNPDNIILGTVYEHEHQEEYEYFQQKQLELKREYYKKYYGKEFD
ncbi:MAG: hypothetical protein ACOWWH_12515 [Eubacteriaceae bacterium]